MIETLFQGGKLFAIILILVSSAPVAGLLVWMAGLALVLKGTSPAERAPILRAYAQCQPSVAAPLRAKAATRTCQQISDLCQQDNACA